MKKISMRLICIVFAVMMALSVSACSNNTNSVENKPKTASELTEALKNAGLPIDNIIVYDEKSDVNELLGRPNQYISKVNFADTTVEQTDKENPIGGTIETFNNAADLKSRKDYIEKVTKDSPLLEQYIYVNGNYLLRVDSGVTPEDAKKYESEFSKLK